MRRGAKSHPTRTSTTCGGSARLRPTRRRSPTRPRQPCPPRRPSRCSARLTMRAKTICGTSPPRRQWRGRLAQRMGVSRTRGRCWPSCRKRRRGRWRRRGATRGGAASTRRRCRCGGAMGGECQRPVAVTRCRQRLPYRRQPTMGSPRRKRQPRRKTRSRRRSARCGKSWASPRMTTTMAATHTRWGRWRCARLWAMGGEHPRGCRPVPRRRRHSRRRGGGTWRPPPRGWWVCPPRLPPRRWQVARHRPPERLPQPPQPLQPPLPSLPPRSATVRRTRCRWPRRLTFSSRTSAAFSGRPTRLSSVAPRPRRQRLRHCPAALTRSPPYALPM